MTATWVLVFLAAVSGTAGGSPNPAYMPLYFPNRDMCEAAAKDLLNAKPVAGQYVPVLLKCEPLGFSRENN